MAVAAEVNVSKTEGEEVVAYPVIADPLIAPAVYGIETVEKSVAITVPTVGASGTDRDMTETDDELALVPMLLLAVTEIEFESPSVKSVMVQELAGQLTEQLLPSGVAVAV